jgi:hypothetical protein
MYPYKTPQILTVQTYTDYGGHTGTASALQVQAALVIAERQMTQELHTFMLPTIITGEYQAPWWDHPVELEYGMVRSFISGTLLSIPTDVSDPYELTTRVRGFIRNSDAGHIDIVPDWDSQWTSNWGPYKVRVVYVAGHGTGTTLNDPSLLMALTAATELVLNEMVAAGTTEAQIGVQRWSSMRYSESRFPLRMTAFGSSARANFISGLVAHLKVFRVGRFRR